MAEQTSTTDPKAVVLAFMAAMEQLDYDTAMTYVAPACEYTNMPLGTVIGPEGIRATLEPFFAPTLSNEWVIKHVVTDGPIVFIERLDRHQLANGWAELPVTGVLEIHDGLITAWREYFDLATITNGMAANA